MQTFNKILEKYRINSFNERDKGDRFERLMQAYLLTDPKYAYLFKKVWLWNEFHGKDDLGGSDTGIDLVALTDEGNYWAIQCKCYKENAVIDKPSVDSFLSTSSRSFKNEKNETTLFSQRLWISTTNKWGPNATEAIQNQNPPVVRLNLHELQQASVDWEKLENGVYGELSRSTKKSLRAHQKEAVDKTHQHFKNASRGKLIMACGTGKTFTSLRIAENETDGKGLILFLVPSIALLGQTLREWSSDADEPINAICICSDPAISKKRTKNDDSENFSIVDLALPASTNTKEILEQFKRIQSGKRAGLTVVFSTYQSIKVISEAQKELLANGINEFDLIICDEAHRTTGVSLAGEEESSFTRVHDNDFIKAKKRLYMTATPRLYNEDSKSKAAQAEAVLCSMDDEKLYGEEMYRIGFGEAVKENLLTDYKVLILTLNDQDVPPSIQKMVSDAGGEIQITDISKLIGCVNALSKQIIGDEGIIKTSDPNPMRRAVAFCANIAESKKITNSYNIATNAYISQLPEKKKNQMVSVTSKHIDGNMSAPTRDELISWLKEEPGENNCRVLTNVRCLSEGVDVPSLDAVMFLSARNSQVDVVQSVGRVMRKSPGKEFGYIIIPIVIPAYIEAEQALDNNEAYKVVWTVLNALKAHDDRFNATVNQLNLNNKRPEQIIIGRPEYTFDFDGNPTIVAEGQAPYAKPNELNKQIAIEFEGLKNVIFARMVKKVGDPTYWEKWAKNIGEIAERQVQRISQIIKDDEKHKKVFEGFLKGLQKNLNPSITQEEVIEMLSQHIITKPVFEALFEKSSFVKNNPISKSMQKMLDLLDEKQIQKDTETLQKFYASIKDRIGNLDNAKAREKTVIELYDKFFKTASPKTVERLGIVYTPMDVVDFAIHSVNHILKEEFGTSLSEENVHILDPFTGTGTFITRLIQSGLIDKKDLERKYKNELHANELVLLAYYIAAVNIENAYHDISGETNYTEFEGICLTDTFQLGETEENEKMFSEIFVQNSDRVLRQQRSPLKIIIGNPPYSIGQKSANDNAQNQSYPKLDAKIASTYAKESSAGLNKSLYDAYIKAFRWSTDRLDANGGIICFVSNGAWLDGNSTDGFRKYLEKEFTSIYVFNLRGNQRTSGELSRKEGGKIFGSGSRTPISVTLLVRNPKKQDKKAVISYYDIGDYLTREEKLSIVNKFSSIAAKDLQWKILQPNESGDWISQRNNIFNTFISLEPVKKFELNTQAFFNTYAIGVNTGRDSWAYNYSKKELLFNMKLLVDFYNQQRIEYIEEKENNKKLLVEDFIDPNPRKISWTRSLRNDLSKNFIHTMTDALVRDSIYRPFNKQRLFYKRAFIEALGLSPKLFPSDKIDNYSICVTGIGASKEFSCLISNHIFNLDAVEKSQCFPLYYYEERKNKTPGMFDEEGGSEYIRRDGISDFILEKALKQYAVSAGTITKEDIFYYVYGFLHSPEYKETFANDLKKMLPRLPLVDAIQDFWGFSKAGEKLADLHINYENVPPYENVSVTLPDKINESIYRVEKMRFPKKDKKDIIYYNSQITISNIPAIAYKYVVNGKSAIEWIMERYAVTTHKESGIKNDPNDWPEEVGNPKYILDLLLSIIHVSVKTVEIIQNLPKLQFE